MVIDCDTCTMRDVACAECVVSFITIPVRRREPGLLAVGGAADLNDAESRAISVLAASGLVPPLRMRRAVAPTG